ncbi:MAG: hypothetical protein AAGC55_02840 [Myxococcota bacterium]
MASPVGSCIVRRDERRVLFCAGVDHSRPASSVDERDNLLDRSGQLFEFLSSTTDGFFDIELTVIHQPVFGVPSKEPETTILRWDGVRYR